MSELLDPASVRDDGECATFAVRVAALAELVDLGLRDHAGGWQRAELLVPSDADDTCIVVHDEQPHAGRDIDEIVVERRQRRIAIPA